MVGKTKSMTKAQKRRIEVIKREIPCVACEIDGFHVSPCDAHHITEAGRRLGHDYTIPLCPWHHRGVLSDSWFTASGPSLAKNKRAFVERYGTERALLERTNLRLRRFEATTIGAST